MGPFLKKEIVKYGKEKHELDIVLKFIDPYYLLRSTPANTADRGLCSYNYY